MLTARMELQEETKAGVDGIEPWHFGNSTVYHNNPACWAGVDPLASERIPSTANKALCLECQRLNWLEGVGRSAGGYPEAQ